MHTPGHICTLIILLLFYAKAAASEWGLLKVMEEPAAVPVASGGTGFDPRKDLLYLPELSGKEFFASIGDLSVLRRCEVRKFLLHYRTDGWEYVRNGLLRSRRYIGTVDDIFAANPDIPGDLKLLPLLESAFNPRAVSRSNAVGLWQFLDGTARILGVLNNRWVDERRSIHRSTEAAIRHLASLHRTFGSWELALAAYNGGAGYLRRAMDRHGTRDFWTLAARGALRRETAEYVPRFAALAVICKNPDLLMPGEEPVAAGGKMRLVEFRYPANLMRISEVTGVSMELLRMYNSELKRDITPPPSVRYTLLIPEEAVEPLRVNMEKVYVMKLSGVTSRRVRRGVVRVGIVVICKPFAPAYRILTTDQ